MVAFAAFGLPIGQELTIPIINGFHLIRRYLKTEGIAISKIAVIATSGSLQSKIYQRYLDENQLVFPDEIVQEKEVMDIIYGPNGIKAGHVSGPVLMLGPAEV